MKYWLKKCPRCRQGDLLEDRDLHGGFVECLQCGYVLSDNETAWLHSAVVWQAEKEKAAA
jgi:hypothetical protein